MRFLWAMASSSYQTPQKKNKLVQSEKEKYKAGFDKIVDQLLDARNIFYTAKIIDNTLYQKHQHGIEIEQLIKDRLMFRILVYANLQFTIRLDQILKDVVDLTKILENYSSTLLKRNQFHDATDEFYKHKLKAWDSLFKITKGQRCPSCNECIRKDLGILNRQGGPSAAAWNCLRARINRFHKPIKEFRDKKAAHTDPEAGDLKIRFEIIRRTFRFIECLLRYFHLLIEKADFDFKSSGTGAWIDPENTAERLIELITREEELKKVSEHLEKKLYQTKRFRWT